MLFKQPYGAAIYFFRKKDGSLRLVINYKTLNQIIIKNKYPPPIINKLIDSFVSPKFLSAIDLVEGYNQVRISEEDIPKTAFRTKYGSFKSLIINYVMSNAPDTFSEHHKESLRKLNQKKCLGIPGQYFCIQSHQITMPKRTEEDIRGNRKKQLLAKPPPVQLPQAGARLTRTWGIGRRDQTQHQKDRRNISPTNSHRKGITLILSGTHHVYTQIHA